MVKRMKMSQVIPLRAQARHKSQVKRLREEANKYLVGGVNSPVRGFGYVGGDPLLLEKGRGARVQDYGARSYIDYVLSWGALILGHGPGEVKEAVRRALEDGAAFGMTHASEIALARAISEAIPFARKVRFTNSGTEAVMGALRLARGVTGRDKIVTFEGEYHGHADHLLARAGSGLATLGIPVSRGVPKNYLKDTIVAGKRDISLVKRIFSKFGRKIAAVIVEPVGGNSGVIAPDIYFLKDLRDVTRHYGALLVFDEVITGFRFHYGAFAKLVGIKPDLITLGKIIGGGLPIGAYAGPDEVMRHLSPPGPVYQASTFAGNPVVMAAGLGTLNVLRASGGQYVKTEERTRMLADGLKKEAAAKSVVLDVARFGSMFSLKFSERRRFGSFYRRMLEAGVFLAPSEYEANFLSFAHTDKDIKRTLDAASWALKGVK